MQSNKKIFLINLWSGSHNLLLGNTLPYPSVFAERPSVRSTVIIKTGRLANHDLASPGYGDWVGAVHVTSTEQSPDIDCGRERALSFIPGYLHVIMVKYQNSWGCLGHHLTEGKHTKVVTSEFRKLEVEGCGLKRRWSWGKSYDDLEACL